MSRVFFIDRDLGRHILPGALERAGFAILRRPQEVRALVESQARMLILVGNHAPADELASNLINTMDKVDELLDRMEPPLVVRVYRPSPRELVAQGKPGRVQPKALKRPGSPQPR